MFINCSKFKVSPNVRFMFNKYEVLNFLRLLIHFINFQVFLNLMTPLKVLCYSLLKSLKYWFLLLKKTFLYVKLPLFKSKKNYPVCSNPVSCISLRLFQFDLSIVFLSFSFILQSVLSYPECVATLHILLQTFCKHL